MFKQDAEESLLVEMSQFPMLLAEPWRVNELVAEESIIQRHRLFKAMSWLRLCIALITLVFFILMRNIDWTVIIILVCYLVVILGLLLRSKQHRYAINTYGLFIGLFDVLILGYLLLITDSNLEFGFLFFSVLLSSMLLSFRCMLIVSTLAGVILFSSWVLEMLSFYQVVGSGMSWLEKFKYWCQLVITNKGLDDFLLLIFALLIMALIVNRLANWSFINEVKAQFRYKQLRQVLSFNRSVIEHLKSGVLVLTADAKVMSINNRAIELLNLSSEQAVMHLTDLSDELMRRFLSWKRVEFEPHHPYKHSDSAEEVSVSFASFGQSENSGVVMMTLESVNESFQQAQEAKLASLGRLTAGVAHEIRNPLSSINSAAELLVESSQTAQQSKLSNMILSNVKRTNQIISDILDLFKDKKSSHELVEVRKVLLKFCQDFSLANKDQDFDIALDEHDDALFMLFDQGQLEQVLWNLAQNSLKYAKREGVRLEIMIKYQISLSKRNIYIDVMDNGDGIREDKRAHIFEPFYTGQSEGSGLGLYLVRELCHSNNANIVYMQREVGACFRLVAQAFHARRKKVRAGN